MGLGLFLDQALFAGEFLAEYLFGGEDETVAAGEELLVAVEYGVADDGGVLSGAEDDADGRILLRLAAFD